MIIKLKIEKYLQMDIFILILVLIHFNAFKVNNQEGDEQEEAPDNSRDKKIEITNKNFNSSIGNKSLGLSILKNLFSNPLYQYRFKYGKNNQNLK